MIRSTISRRAMLVAGSIGATGAGLHLHVAAQQGGSVPITDWWEMIQRQHDGIAAAFDSLVKLGTDGWVARFRVVNQLLNAHQQGEENVLYPALVRAGLKAAAEKLYSEESEVKVLRARLVLLADQKLASEEWQGIARELQQRVLQHAKQHEEKELFPELHRRLGETQNALISNIFSRSFNSVEPTLPGRANPTAAVPPGRGS